MSIDKHFLRVMRVSELAKERYGLEVVVSCSITQQAMVGQTVGGVQNIVDLIMMVRIDGFASDKYLRSYCFTCPESDLDENVETKDNKVLEIVKKDKSGTSHLCTLHE